MPMHKYLLAGYEGVEDNRPCKRQMVDVYDIAIGSDREAFHPEDEIFVEFIGGRNWPLIFDDELVDATTGIHDAFLDTADVGGVLRKQVGWISVIKQKNFFCHNTKARRCTRRPVRPSDFGSNGLLQRLLQEKKR